VRLLVLSHFESETHAFALHHFAPQCVVVVVVVFLLCFCARCWYTRIICQQQARATTTNPQKQQQQQHQQNTRQAKVLPAALPDQELLVLRGFTHACYHALVDER
jgi:hypothetical protein